MNASPFSARLNQTFLSPSLAAFSPALNRVVPSFFCACCGGISAANLFFFFMCSRSFILSRPSRRKLKQSGILKERVFGCDLGEHLLNSARESESTVVSLKDTRKIPKDAEKMPPYS